MKFQVLPILLSTLSLLSVPLIRPAQAEELACPEEFDGIELSDNQITQLEDLEEQLDNRIETIMPPSPESEARVNQLEKAFEQQITSLLSAEQKQQVTQLDAWAEEQAAGIAPELLTSEDDIDLTDDQEVALETLEEEYEQNYQSILTPEQQQQVELLEEQLDAEIEASMPEPSAEQAVSIEMAEAEFEQGMITVLTEEQLQQLEGNLAACTVPDAPLYLGLVRDNTLRSDSGRTLKPT